ncbi:chondroitin sulfate proteoglycan 4-like isoform X2 [Corythoichthys intestinalis]|uniref:chondroitin sulfate proteoglycan 4-like isoform X2 n=1 Tax=Corythoichthys intestinalis TaxID=161448 RepID=UPI0025A567CC|nr:chondroitin sulfate proteoglycan 4-like isoform X2 [Corythoichthys intestinalis]XP_061800749.1 chondroitin sulfate proteoglycan 4-like [Nerophis lumbriciformis]
MGRFVAELLLLLLVSTGQVYAVSFYGNSSIHLQTAEASFQTLLRIQFRTSSQQGLLFLAVGPRDFMLLELTSGCLQVHVDLGSGERSLRLESDTSLSDLLWHSVEVIHNHHRVSMTMDGRFHTRVHMPGPDLELSVDSLFVGSALGLNHPHLVNISSGFRGCLDEAVFNELNLLSSLRPYTGYESVHEVSLGCSQLFSATEDDSIHFFSSNAFITLPTWETEPEGVFECKLHLSGREDDGLVLYSAIHQGAVVLEIREGHLVAIVATTEGRRTELYSNTKLHSNLTWYPIQLHILPYSVELKVGEELLQASLSPALELMQLKGPLFLGGLEEQTWIDAMQTGLVSSKADWKVTDGGGSFRGCLREIKVNSQITGLPHVIISKDISVGCKMGQTSDNVSNNIPTHIPELHTLTEKEMDDRNNSTILFLRSLEVAEGSWAVLEPKHIKVNLDFTKLGLHPSEFMFRIEKQGVHGNLQLDSSPEDPKGREEADLVFSMLDLWQGRVAYVHSGSEGLHDCFMFSVFSSTKEIQVYLKEYQLYQFDINISPVNDAPMLSLPKGNVFMLLQYTKRQLTKDLLDVSDPDSSEADLVFSAMGNFEEAGHLEHIDQPNRAVKVFSLHDLEEGKISFVHTGVSNSRMALRISDGQKFSTTVILRIHAVELAYNLVNNTGLEVNQGEASFINTNHLAVQINVADQPVEILYDVTELPQFGELQCLHSSGKWKPTKSFSQKLLAKEQIRYLSTFRGIQTQNVTDQFKCKVSIGSLATEKFVFVIRVRWIHFKVTRSKMEVNGVLKVVVTPEDLHVITKGVKLSESDLYFRLLTEPKKGQLLLIDRVLKRDSTFSQKNITDGLVTYELFAQLPDDNRDICSFQAFSTLANSTSHDFRIHIRTELTDFTIVNKGLSVTEGGSAIITKSTLFTHTASNREVHYSITEHPRHGQIRRNNLSNSTLQNDNTVGYFTNQDIIEERVMYVHDDSETKQDSFTFQIVVYKPTKLSGKKEERNTAEHIVNISIQLINDQRPVRVIDKVFHVARDGQRLVTLNDLCYQDDDSDFEDDWLIYTRRGIPMGELVQASAPNQKLYEFTQRDLKQKKVLFMHNGVSFGRFVFFVSDGKHYVSTLMEVKAEDPYLEVNNNTGLVVQRGGITTLTSCNLSIFSNLDIRESQQVTFEVFLPPKHGVLHFKGAKTAAGAVSSFTQKDLEMESLVYRHDGSNELSDGFNITARAREGSGEGQSDDWRREVHLDIGVQIKIYLESHQKPPTVINNHPVVVAEGHNVSLNKAHLEVVHGESQPSEIVFIIQKPPTLGWIERFSNEKKRRIKNGRRLFQELKRQPTASFTQEDINKGLVIYHQRTMGSSNDSALLEATNGLTKVGPIRLEIDIIPSLLPLKVSDLNLDEGSSLPLTPDIITIDSHHFSGLNFLYQIVIPPRHGHLEHSRIPGMPISAFTHTEVEREYISYIHDGSDTVRDNFTIMANLTEHQKHSLPCTIHINVTPVNDETPVVTNNQGLKVWVGSVTEISADALSAEDLDTPPESLEFIVTPPSNGFLALRSSSSRHILNFTQSHIAKGQLVFVHSGDLSGGFHFQVNDGVNFAPRQIFRTTAHSLVLTLQRNHPIEVYPGSLTPISEQELQVLTNDPTDLRRNQTVTFTVTVPPNLGRLVCHMSDNSTQDISTFTQSMVNSGVILYDQNKPESVGWLASDTFSFTVSSPPAFLPPTTFTILISYEANKHRHHQYNTKLSNNAGAVVSEGGRVTIDQSKLDASNLLGKVPTPLQKDHHVVYHVISLPHHGTLSIQGCNLTSDQPDFSQITLNKFGITYIHDDSETTSDSFTFKAWVAPMDTHSPSSPSHMSAFSMDSSSSLFYSTASSLSSVDLMSFDYVKDSLPVTETFNITVMPVNDQPPLIRNRSPSMKVVVGERVILGPDNLQVEDHDTPPEELHYLVISKPNNGYLTLGERPEPVTSFTQYDVNHSRLHFIQQGEPSTGVFYFNVTDGHHRPLYKRFSLEVIKPFVSIVNNTGLSLVQGRTAVILTTNQLAAQTNSRTQANITYTVTTHPRHGRIAINDQEVMTFFHEDLQHGRVVYHMTDLSESEDSFQISVSASAPGVEFGNVTAQTVKVIVRPLIYLREPVRVPSGIAVKLGKAMMDASELARISRVNPVFEVLSPPKHGKLVKMTYDPKGAPEVLKSFTFRDVVQGRVAIEETLSDSDSQPLSNKSLPTTTLGHAPATPRNDSFVFLLKAGNVQPAKGELHFTILPHHHMHHRPTGSKKSDGASSEHKTTRNKTTTEAGRGGGRKGVPTSNRVEVDLHPHILTHKNHNKTHHKQRSHHRVANHTRSGVHGSRSGSGVEGPMWGGGSPPQPRPHAEPEQGPAKPPDTRPIHVEVLPRPASDPLLIILPLLACLLLIVILVVLILVFRHRKEKQARMRLLQELAAVHLPSEGSPFLGRPERSMAAPSVMVTPLTAASCPTSPRAPEGPRRRSLAPGMTFWGPFDTEATSSEENMRHYETNTREKVIGRSSLPAISVEFKTSHRSKSPIATLKDNQYWV